MEVKCPWSFLKHDKSELHMFLFGALLAVLRNQKNLFKSLLCYKLIKRTINSLTNFFLDLVGFDNRMNHFEYILIEIKKWKNIFILLTMQSRLWKIIFVMMYLLCQSSGEAIQFVEIFHCKLIELLGTFIFTVHMRCGPFCYFANIHVGDPLFWIM
jgi:hypothetical protein